MLEVFLEAVNGLLRASGSPSRPIPGFPGSPGFSQGSDAGSFGPLFNVFNDFLGSTAKNYFSLPPIPG
jgi:hypothetical protein